MSIVDRIMARVEVNAETGCWVWQGGCNGDGYGQITDDSGTTQKVHRVMYEHSVASIQHGMKICHSCDNPPCCNPAHLFQGTDAENREDARQKGRLPHGERAPTAVISDSVAIEVIERLMRRESHRSIARLLGIKPSVVHDIHAGRTWRHLTSGRRFPCARPRIKVPADVVRDIRRRASEGHSYRSIASLLSVGCSTVRRIATGESRRDVQ